MAKKTPEETLKQATTEQAFTSAIYNSLAIIFLIVGISLCALLLIVLQAFVRSILWALLTGAFLFQFKKYLTDKSCSRLKTIEKLESCITFQILLLPFKLIDSTSDYIYEFFKKNYIQLVGIVVSILLLNYINILYEPFIDYVLIIVNFFTEILKYFVFYVDNSWYISFTIIIAYLASIIFYWNNDTKFLFKLMAVPVWTCFLVLISQILGKYRIFFLIFLFLITCIGVISNVSQKLNQMIEQEVPVRNNEEEEENVEELGPNVSTELDKEAPKPSLKKLKLKRSLSTKEIILNNCQSDRYFKFLFWFYVGITLWSYQVISLIVFIVIWKILKIMTNFLSNVLYKKFDIESLIVKIKDWISERQEIITPTPFKILLNFYYIGDYKMNRWLRGSISAIISAVMIFALLLFLISTIILLAIEVQYESLKLISIISNIINENIYSQPELKSLLPEKDKVNELLQEGINKFYVYGRDWLSNLMKSFVSSDGHNDDQKIVEKQLLSQWDLVYNFLSQKALNITTNSTNSLNITLTNISSVPSILSASKPIFVRQKSLTSTSGGVIDWSLLMNKDYWNYKYLIATIKENIGIVISLADSIYLIIKSNFNLFFKIFKVILSALFQSGFAVFNFFISFIVYITALFYLLSSSADLYKPLYWMNEITIFKTNYGQLLSKSVEESIRSVFAASLKIGAFYGFYTWLIHHIFGVSIAYLPSIFASIFGFLPILSTYWVCLPGILELWLLQNQPFLAILFLICHVSPTYIVDTSIYSEIKGSHPYFTGLAIAGGLYCGGLEGALIGPIILCLFIVIIRMNKEILMKTTD